MLSLMRQKFLSSNFVKSNLIVFAFLIFALASGHDFLHNHELDGHEHDECPVHRFRLVLASIDIVFFVYEPSFVSEILALKPKKICKESIDIFLCHSRSPPNFIY